VPQAVATIVADVEHGSTATTACSRKPKYLIIATEAGAQVVDLDESPHAPTLLGWRSLSGVLAGP
jgi:hypothetical protein